MVHCFTFEAWFSGSCNPSTILELCVCCLQSQTVQFEELRWFLRTIEIRVLFIVELATKPKHMLKWTHLKNYHWKAPIHWDQSTWYALAPVFLQLCSILIVINCNTVVIVFVFFNVACNSDSEFCMQLFQWNWVLLFWAGIMSAEYDHR